jgi:cation diffusion facilitator family transporter
LKLKKPGTNSSKEELSHTHFRGVVDPELLSTARGLHAVKWSFIGLMATALFQIYVFRVSGSVALLADTINNFGDAVTAIFLGFAFLLSLKKPNDRFTYGYGRAEDLAGLLVIFLISLSAVIAAYEAISRLLIPQTVEFFGAVAVASIVGFLGE